MDTIERAIQKLTGKSPKTAVTRRPPESTFERAGQRIPIDTPSPLLRPASDRELAETPKGPPPVELDTADFVAPPRMLLNEPPAHRVAVPQDKIRDAGMIIPDERRSRIKEEYRLIKRPLLMNAAGKGASLPEFPNLMMVTSANPGEGKTFTAINLALSIASERDLTVLLVDADMLKPRLSAFFDVEQQPGLVDLLVDDRLSLPEVVVATDIPSLSLLPAGNTHHLTTELMASRNMRDLAETLCRYYPDQIVIFDTPPLLATPEASVLAHLVGQIVMVVEARRTLQSQVREALTLLDPDMIVGFVMNRTRRLLGDYLGHGYGQYGDGSLS